MEEYGDKKVGDILKEARKGKDLTFNKIEEDTKIRAKFLQALEQGEYDKIPGEVYVKGFLRNYATYLGLDPMVMLEKYRQEQSGESITGLKKVSALAKNEAQGVRETERGRRGEEKDKENNRRKGISPGWIVAIVLVILLGVGIAWYVNRPSGEGLPAPDDTQSESAEIDMGVGQSGVPNLPPEDNGEDGIDQTPQPNPEESIQTPDNSVEGLVLTIKTLQEDCWVEVRADGRIIYSETIPANSEMTWKADEHIKIRLGNAGSAELILNGENLGVAGEMWQVEDKEFSIQRE
jgi:hypothetical protein